MNEADRQKLPVIEPGMYTNIRDLSYEACLFIVWVYMKNILATSADRLEAFTVFDYIYAHPRWGVIFVDEVPEDAREMTADAIAICTPE